MPEKEQPKIEVKVSSKIIIPFWTAGFLYTTGALLSQPSQEFFAEPWYVQGIGWLVLYILWPTILGMIHFGGW